MTFSFRHIFNLIVVVLLAIYVITAMGYNPDARLMPLVVSIPILILAIGLFIHELRTPPVRKKREEEKASEPAEGEPRAGGELSREVNAFVWAVGLFVSFYLIGFTVTTGLFTFLSLKVRSHFGWRASIAVAAGCLAFLYVVMIYGLNVDLYPGVIMVALRKAIYGY